CHKLGYKTIISTSFRDFLPKALPENVIWVEFCPFRELLPLIDLIVHHGGIGTTCESVANVVPQLIIGQGFDRQHNGRVIKKLGLGDWIAPKALSEDILIHKINSLMEDKGILSRCEQYKSRLYDHEALQAFYESLLDPKSSRTLKHVGPMEN